jgi:hypothetical protein
MQSMDEDDHVMMMADDDGKIILSFYWGYCSSDNWARADLSSKGGVGENHYWTFLDDWFNAAIVLLILGK